MSQKGVSEVIGNLVCDEKFRADFKNNPEKTLAGFDLTKEEAESLKKLKDKDIGSMSAKDIAGALAGTIGGSAVMAQ